METSIPSVSKKLPLKQKVEAILFAVGARITLANITRLAKSREDAVKEVLLQLKEEYAKKDGSLTLIEDGDTWKLAVHDHYLSVVKKIVTETELSKTVLETLAVIAFKYPIRQSDLIKIRTNKGYDHLKELEGQGFISRKKHGRTNLIKLTEKFFQYFDLPEEKLKEHLADFESIAQAIVKKETELASRKQQQSDDLKQMQSQDDRIKQEIDNLDAKQGSPEEQPSEGTILITPEKVGPLEVYEEKQEITETNEGKVAIYDVKEETFEDPQSPSPKTKPIAKDQSEEKGSEQPSGIIPTPEMQKEIDRKVEEMVSPKKEASDENDGPKGYDTQDNKGDDELEQTLDTIRKKKKQDREQ